MSWGKLILAGGDRPNFLGNSPIQWCPWGSNLSGPAIPQSPVSPENWKHWGREQWNIVDAAGGFRLPANHPHYQSKTSPDWAKVAAYRRAYPGTQLTAANILDRWDTQGVAMRLAAELIAQHEDEPIAPEIMAAREIRCKAFGNAVPKTAVTSDKYDNKPIIKSILMGIEWGRANPCK